MRKPERGVLFDRDTLKEELLKRTQESDERKEGESLAKYFDPDMELNFVKFPPTKEEPHIFDIIPWIAGNKMPSFMRIKEGKPAYYLDIYVHQNIGPAKTWVVCPSNNYGEPCPICEYIDELVRDGKEYDDYSDIAPKRRCVYNVLNQSTEKEIRKGVQIWEVSHRFSEKPIQAAAKNPRGGGSIPFSHPGKDVGASISFSVDKDKYHTISGHKLVPREEDISDEILSSAYQLDQIIKVYSYKEITKIFSKVEVDGDDVPEYEEKERVVEDRPIVAKAPSGDVCPGGGEFGVDIDQLTECEECAIYRKCSKKAIEIEEDQKASRSKVNTRKRM
jgi:hypothetical protein